jgi:hypothetical protein
MKKSRISQIVISLRDNFLSLFNLKSDNIVQSKHVLMTDWLNLINLSGGF